MPFTVADIYSQADRFKRRVKDIASNPLQSLLESEGVGRLKEFNQLNDIAMQGDLARMRGQEPTAEQIVAENKVRDIWASGYNPTGITVYHGSPHLFRRLDPSKIGTGEGAQAYGAGAGYTAEARPVAEIYKRMDSPFAAAGLKGPEATVAALAKIDAGKQNPAEFLKQNRANYKQFSDKEINKAISSLESGYLYEGDIPDELLPKFLDWDKPLSQQSKEIKDAAKTVWNQRKNDLAWKGKSFDDFLNKETGESLYLRLGNGLRDREADLAASKFLESIGAKGIRYLDQESRGAGKGTSNFIPFRPQDFDIRKINDIPIQEWEAKGAFK